MSAETTKQCCHELQESGTTLLPASSKQRLSRCLRVVANPAHLYAPLVLALPAEQDPALNHLDVLKSAVFEMQCFQATSQVMSPSPPPFPWHILNAKGLSSHKQKWLGRPS